MDQGRTVKKISEGKPDVSRRRPRLRLLEDVDKDLREMKLRDGDKKLSIGKNGRP